MDDLISRTHIANVIGDWYNNINYHPETGYDPYNAAILEAENAVIAECIKAIDDEPAVDAEPVRRGRWIGRGRYDEDGYYNIYFICSECGREEPYKEPYCHCGARMEEEGSV